jgi:hypothetical protein
VSVVSALRARRNPIPHACRIPVWCAGIALATSVAAVLATVSIAGWNPTVLVRMAEEQQLAPLARAADPDFVFVHYHGRGDGVSYYAIARDPLARGEEHRLFTWPAYRYGHPGYSWLAWALTLGSAALVPYAFLVLNLVGMGVAGAAASLIARELGYTEWAGLAIALNPGLIYSTTIDTSEPVAAALLLVVLLLWLRGRWRLALPLIVALCFMKEWFVLVPVGLALWEPLRFVRTRRPELRVRSGALVLTIVPSASGICTSSFTSASGRRRRRGTSSSFLQPAGSRRRGLRPRAGLGRSTESSPATRRCRSSRPPALRSRSGRCGRCACERRWTPSTSPSCRWCSR